MNTTVIIPPEKTNELIITLLVSMSANVTAMSELLLPEQTKQVNERTTEISHRILEALFVEYGYIDTGEIQDLLKNVK